MSKECKTPGKTPKDVLGDKDIPYEVRMKYIIDAYRKDQEKWGRLAEYAKHLEAEVARLNEVIKANGYVDPGAESVPKSAEVMKELRAQIYELRGRLKELDEYERIIKEMQERIDTFPLRIYKSRCFKSIIHFQKMYIEELQELLDKNNIPYVPRMPVNELEKEGVDKVVESALEYKTRYEIEYTPTDLDMSDVRAELEKMKNENLN